jgi:L-alanine-DL-glutamate epimerase-like enolase superfamily enzyme
MLQGDVDGLSGVTSLLRAAHLADGFNMPCEVFYGRNSVNSFANLDVVTATRNCQFFVAFPPTGGI